MKVTDRFLHANIKRQEKGTSGINWKHVVANAAPSRKTHNSQRLERCQAFYPVQ